MLRKWPLFRLSVLAALLWPMTSNAAELVIFERGGCVWCERWHRDVGASYGKTDEARVLPLRRVNVDAQATSRVALASPVRYTPTFVVVDDGREIGRIIGYISDDAFWGLLGSFVARVAIPPLQGNPARQDISRRVEGTLTP